MAIPDTFVKAVSEGNMQAVHRRLADLMPIDPSLHMQDEMLKYAEEKLPNLYQTHDGDELKTDAESWTEAYYDQERYRLEKNFSRERLNMLRDLTRHMYADVIQREETEARQHQQSAPQQYAKKSGSAKLLGGAAAVVGAAAVAVGVVASSTAVSVIGAVVVVGGIVVLATDAAKK
ncbi:MAG: hypothetical protein LBN02_04805 [Oscillospiraceae bacterium]|nr:hypothetical protein [Oscillospiraceae bacterium]